MECNSIFSNDLDEYITNDGDGKEKKKRNRRQRMIKNRKQKTIRRRVSYNGITLGFQPKDAGSIPVTRSS